MIARKQTSIKVDPLAWEEAREILKGYNLTVSDAVNIFLNKVRLTRGLPFDVVVPPADRGNHIETLRHRSLRIEPTVDVDALMDEMNDGLS